MYHQEDQVQDQADLLLLHRVSQQTVQAEPFLLALALQIQVQAEEL